MAKVLVVTSGKGGVGKTTSTAALGAALAQIGQKVAVVDFDVGLRNLELFHTPMYSDVVAYGFAIGVCQFGLLFLGIKLGMPAGLSSLVIQMQVFFTIGLAVAFAGDHLRRQGGFLVSQADDAPHEVAQRPVATRRLADEFGATVLLKGHHTLVAEPDGRVRVISGSAGPACRSCPSTHRRWAGRPCAW